jgi:molybdenum cofactor cytidylyltransferase
MNFALIPAGGHSIRMGKPKLLLPLGNRSVLEHVIATLREAAVDRVVVVVGAHVPELAPLARSAGAEVVLLKEQTPDMRATVEQGLVWLEEHFQPKADDAWLLVPADHPTLEVDSVRELLAARRLHSRASIFVPTFQSKRGHPALIGWKHVAGIRGLRPGLGLNAYLRERAEEIIEVPVQSAAILADLDTPEDYERLLRGDAGGNA